MEYIARTNTINNSIVQAERDIETLTKKIRELKAEIQTKKNKISSWKQELKALGKLPGRTEIVVLHMIETRQGRVWVARERAEIPRSLWESWVHLNDNNTWEPTLLILELKGHTLVPAKVHALRTEVFPSDVVTNPFGYTLYRSAARRVMLGSNYDLLYAQASREYYQLQDLKLMEREKAIKVMHRDVNPDAYEWVCPCGHTTYRPYIDQAARAWQCTKCRKWMPIASTKKKEN